MPSNRAKPKWYSDWLYTVRLRHCEPVPLRTTEDGVKFILRHDGIHPEAFPEFLESLATGGQYEPRRGLFKNIHRRPLDIEERLRDTANRIDKIGPSICWWNKATRAVWWLVSDEDATLMNTGSTTVTSPVEIRQMFLSHAEVQYVRVEREAGPNLRRDPRWIEIYPGRF